jgi:hypothetical protein
MTDIWDIKPPQDTVNPILLGVLIVSPLVIAGIVFFVLKSGILKKPLQQVTQAGYQMSLQYEKFLALQTLGRLIHEVQTKPEPDYAAIYFQLSETARKYLGLLKNIQALNQTKQEVALSLKITQLDDILEHCYRAEFAAQKAGQEDTLEVLQQAARLIQSHV